MKIHTPWKPLPAIAVMASLLPVAANAAIILHDDFDEAVGQPPANWTAVESPEDPSRQHALIEAGSLSYPNLAPPAGNSLGLGNKTEDYATDFAAVTPGAGESIYVSFVMVVNSMTRNFGNQFGGSFQLQAGSTYLSIGLGTTDFESGNFGFSLSGNNRGYGHADSVTGDNLFAAGTVHLVVAEYDSAGTVNLWVNPASSSFGTDTPPAVYLTDPGTASATDFTRLRISNNGSGGLPADWALDEVRIGTTWSEVAPVPEPATIAFLLGICALGFVAWRRRR